MKTKMYPKLLILAILSTMFIFISFRKAEVRQIPASANKQLHQDVKIYSAQVDQDYWIRWKNQFVWTSPANGPTLLPGKPGC
jgi:hypothetical protein